MHNCNNMSIFLMGLCMTTVSVGTDIYLARTEENEAIANQLFRILFGWSAFSLLIGYIMDESVVYMVGPYLPLITYMYAGIPLHRIMIRSLPSVMAMMFILYKTSVSKKICNLLLDREAVSSTQET